MRISVVSTTLALMVAIALLSSTGAANGGCPPDMVLVGGATFPMGDGEALATPVHQVTVAPFCLDRTEVTVAAYQRCVVAGRCAAPLARATQPGDADAKMLAAISARCNRAGTGRDQHPMNCIDWSEAERFCSSSKKRLPTEAVWELAARGAAARRFPWGDAPPTHKRANLLGGESTLSEFQKNIGMRRAFEERDGFVETAPVGSYPDGASPEGVLDLVGNVSEWVADWDGPYPAEAVTNPRGPATGRWRGNRGTSYHSPGPVEPAAMRYRDDPTVHDPTRGVRCAATPR